MRNQPMHTTEGLAGNDGRRDRLLVLWAIDEPAERVTGVVVNHAARAAGSKDSDSMLVCEKVADLFEEGHLPEHSFPECRIVRQHMTVILIAVERVRTEVVELGLVVMLERVRRVRINLGRVAVKNDLARKLALPRVKIFLVAESRHSDDLAARFPGR